jgi:rare lipoprotein A
MRIATLLLALVLSACGSTPAKHRAQHPYFDGAPPAQVDLSQIPEPVPKFEPIARYGNPATYSVLGQNYALLPSRAGYVARGTASWYGTKFHGKLTSNREPYDMYSFSAAHKTLPIPTYARVTNLANQKSIVVRINDRGPFVGDRIIDLSYVAALKLGMQTQGTAAVEITTITPGEYAPEVAPVVTPPITTIIANPITHASPEPLLLLQCGAFGDFSNANALKVALLDAGFSDARVISGQDRLNRVVLGPLANKADADNMSQKLTANGFNAPKVIVQ